MVRLRLEMLVPHLNTWPQAVALLSAPEALPSTLLRAHGMIDSMWLAAGDASDDHNWHVKRLLLAAVYGSTELFMLADPSPGQARTWEFLEQRVADTLQLGTAAAQAERAVLLAAGGLGK